MFLCAVTHPRYDNRANCWFDGKIGLWPIGKFAPAQRSSHNCPAGTLVWQNTSVTREVYRDILINKLIPAIHKKWPLNGTKAIRIQQDGAKAHIPEDDQQFRDALDAAGLQQTTLYNQAANSPDLNVNDLGFFRAIQSATDRSGGSEKDLIDNVLRLFEEFPKEKLNRIWITLQSVLNAIIESNGDNDYKIPHLGKENMEWSGCLLRVLEVTDHATRWQEDEQAFIEEFQQEFENKCSNLLFSKE
ncbi:hypothetical protein ACA910_011691 [Epithemia clementina (nom. ined.)]